MYHKSPKVDRDQWNGSQIISLSIGGLFFPAKSIRQSWFRGKVTAANKKEPILLEVHSYLGMSMHLEKLVREKALEMRCSIDAERR
jgi:hypothetical protein